MSTLLMVYGATVEPNCSKFLSDMISVPKSVTISLQSTGRT